MEYLFRNILLFITICLFSKDSVAQGLSFLEEKKLYYDSVYNEAISTGDELMLAEAYYLYGKYYNAKREYKTCLKFFFKALKIHEAHPPSFNHGRCLQFIGYTYIFLENPKLAWQHHIAAENIYKQAHSEKGLIGMPTTYFELKLRFPEYFEKNKSNLPKIEKEAFKKYKPIPDINIAHFRVQNLISQNKYKEALEILSPFDIEYDGKIEPSDFLPLKVELAFCYLRNDQLDLSEEQLKDAEKVLILSKSDVGEMAISYHKVAEELYRKLSRWKLAHFHLQELKRLESLKLEEDRNGSIAKLTLAYEDEKKNNQILKQQENLKLQQNWLLAFGVGITVLTALGLVFYFLYKKTKRLSQENKILLKEQNHRVKNNLQVLSSLLKLQARRVKDETAKKQLSESQMRIESISLMHQRLHGEDSDARLNFEEYLNELIKAILISFNLENKVTISLQILFDDLRTEHTLYLSLIINELITNACKYAFGETNDPEIEIQLQKISNKILELYVRDNGKGMNNNPGFGTKLISMQVDQLNGDFYYYNDQGTHFKMTFPL